MVGYDAVRLDEGITGEWQLPEHLNRLKGTKPRMGVPRFTDSVRELEFRYDGERIHPDAVFGLVYGGLQKAVAMHQAANPLKRSTKLPKEQHYEEMKRQVRAWAKNGVDIDVTARMDDGESIDFKVRRRTNFELGGLIKIPNIVYLQAPDDSIVILREARVYDTEKVVKPLVQHFYGHTRYNPEIATQFHSDAQGNLSPAHRKQVAPIPEPQLIRALEKMYKEAGLPRVTTPLKALASRQDRLWVVRDFYGSMKDLSFELDRYAAYVGTLHAVGLMEVADRQWVHYCPVDGDVVTFDPDFMVHTTNKGLLRGSDVSDAVKMFENESAAIFPFEKPDRKDLLKGIDARRDELEEKGITPPTLFDYLEREISTNGLPKVDLII